MDDGSPIGLFLLFLLCLVGSFYFSGTEMAFSSVSRTRMQARADRGEKRAARVLSILDDFDRALTTLLIGNNIVNISCATIATIIAARLWGSVSVAATTLVVTVIVFMLGETLPKSFAKANNESFTMAVAGSLSLLMKVLRPLVFLFTKITRLVAKPFRRGTPRPTVTGDELRDIIEDAVEEGALNEETGELVQSVVRFTDASVRDILTPWKDVRKLKLTTPHDEVLRILQRTTHSRLPVVDDTGEVVGLLRVRRYLKATMLGNAQLSVKGLMLPVHSISDSLPVDELLPLFSSQKTHFALVRDEWDNVLGIVTMEDILERLVGDIWDEDDAVLLQGGDA